MLLPIPAFSDNYIWMLVRNSHAWIIDPGEAAPVVQVLHEKNLKLAGILITHHHADHTGGIVELLQHHSVPVYGPCNSPARKLISHVLKDGDCISLGGIEFSVIAVPGHTLDHIAFYSAVENILLCGDTLFSAGCGRVFEGTHEQMYESLLKLAALPGDTKFYCAHEYTLANLLFAIAVEPDNQDIIQYQRQCEAIRAKNLPTLPSTIALEKKINPFLRCNNALQFSERRRQKNNF